MSVIKPIGDPNILQKKVPKSKKYANAQATIDTGTTVDKLIKQVGGEHVVNSRFKKNELFKRMKCKALAEHLASPTIEMLILDIREQDEYNACHINGGEYESLKFGHDYNRVIALFVCSALHYPSTMISRSVNPYKHCPQIYDFINKPEKIIVIYDYDEKVGEKCATLFFEKGVDNVLLLTGGLKKFVEKFGTYVIGKPPTPPSTPKSQRSTSSPQSVRSFVSAPSVRSSVSSLSSISTKASVSTSQKTKPWK